MNALAAGQVFTQHSAALRGFLGARCRDAELTGELLQEVAARLVAAAPRLDPSRNVRGYLFRTAANVWRDHVRREIARRHTAEGYARVAPTHAEPADARVIERELRAAVRCAIAELPEAQRAVVELRHRDGLTFQRIADRLGRPLGTVLTQMHAALKTIGAALESHR